MSDGWGISCEIALILMSLDFTDDQLTLVQVMAWCRQATSHYLSQCWPRSMSLYGVTRPQWVLILAGHGNPNSLSLWGTLSYDQNACAWVLWYWVISTTLTDILQPIRLSEKFKWRNEDQCKMCKTFFLFIAHMKQIHEPWPQKWTKDSLRAIAVGAQCFFGAFSCPHESVLRDCTRVWPSSGKVFG